jgi:hypothetical protein
MERKKTVPPDWGAPCDNPRCRKPMKGRAWRGKKGFYHSLACREKMEGKKVGLTPQARRFAREMDEFCQGLPDR